MADNRFRSLFGDYSDGYGLQALIDKRMDKFKTPFFPQFFDFTSPTVTLNYSTVIGRSRIEAAASVVAHGAQAPLRSRANLEKYQGEVATIKVARTMSEADYRTYLTIQSMPVPDDDKKRQIMRLIWEDVEYVGNSIQDRIDIMCAQALSSGIISISSTTNPDGLITTDIDLLMSSDNKKGVAVAWSAANAATMTPLTDFDNLITAAEAKGTTFDKILMPKALWRIFSNCTQVINALKGYYRIERGAIYEPTMDMVNTYLQANMYPTIQLVDITKSIEKDGVLSVYKPWTAANCSFVPAGKLGVIHQALPIEKVRPVTGTAYADFKGALIKKWMQQSPFAEITEGEMNAFPGLEAIDSIYLLQTTTVA